MMALRMLLAAVAALAPACFSLADDSVIVRFAATPTPDVKTLFAASADISNGVGKWHLGMKNLRSHGVAPRKFSFSTGNGRQNGFSGLISSVALEVNGIPWEKLLVRERGVRQWSPPGDRRGVEMFFNFDGVPVRVRASMAPGSPTLDFEVTPSARGQAAPTSMVVRVSSIPSFLDCGSGRPTRFFGYRRQVHTEKRLMGPVKSGKFALDAGERVFVMEDADYDGASEGRGHGPSAVLLADATSGFAHVNDSWTVDIRFAPDPSKTFRFSLLEWPERRVSNADFEREAAAVAKSGLGSQCAR